MECVGAAVGAGALEAGDEAEVAGDDLTHDVGEDHSVVGAVAPGHEADPVAADILSILDENQRLWVAADLWEGVHGPREHGLLLLHCDGDLVGHREYHGLNLGLARINLLLDLNI